MFTKLLSNYTFSCVYFYVIVVDRVYHGHKTKKSDESKGHGDQLNTSKIIINRHVFLFLSLFLFFHIGLFLFFSAFNLSLFLFPVCFCPSLSYLLFYRSAQHVAGGEWTVATVPAKIILLLYPTFFIPSIISSSSLIYFFRSIISIVDNVAVLIASNVHNLDVIGWPPCILPS